MNKNTIIIVSSRAEVTFSLVFSVEYNTACWLDEGYETLGRESCFWRTEILYLPFQNYVMSCRFAQIKRKRIRIAGDLEMVNSSEIRGGRKGLISILFAVIYYD